MNNSRRMEKLSRSLTIVKTNNGILIEWRSLGTDNKNTTFKLYKNHVLIKEINKEDQTNYLDQNGYYNEQYMLETYKNNKLVETSYPERIINNINEDSSGAFFDIPIERPEEETMPDGRETQYLASDGALGDVDGDGEYEIILKWNPSNIKDNSEDGYTGNVFIDCYKMNGKKLWRIDLGQNIRAGAHYTQMMVYDLDGDNKAEVVLKTSDKTIDGLGNIIGDNKEEERPNKLQLLEKSEYLTLFDGETGKALDSILYEPRRGNISEWGDDTGNRSERNLATIAYLNGKTPSLVMIRGYYEKIEAVAYNVVNKKLIKKWRFNSKDNTESDKATSNGNHQVIAADIDNDLKDEIILGSTVIDDNGKIKYSTSLGHGDQLHVGDFIKENKGLEIFMCHENKDIGYGISLRDAKTGKILFRNTGEEDANRCIIDNIKENEVYMSGAHNYKLYDTKGEYIDEWYNKITTDINSLIYWDGDLQRELLDGTRIEKIENGVLFEGKDVISINNTKNNAVLSADIFGDWREEVIYPTKNQTNLRVFTTTYETKYKINTLMHNPLYRIGVANQNVGYNISPHLDYYLEEDQLNNTENKIYTTN